MDWQSLVPIVVGTIALTSAVTVAVINGRATPYSALSDRVLRLEQQVTDLSTKVTHLEAERTGLREYVRTLFAFIDTHIPATVPRPCERPTWLQLES